MAASYRCPDCGMDSGRIGPTRAFCPRCLTEFDIVAQQKSPKRNTYTKLKQACSVCGNVRQLIGGKCPRCYTPTGPCAICGKTMKLWRDRNTVCNICYKKLKENQTDEN